MEATHPHCEAAAPGWLTDFANSAAAGIRANDVLAPVGCHYYRNQARDEWEVTLFVSRTQVVGGAFDGRSVLSRFDVDIDAVSAVFDKIPSLRWQAHRRDDDDEIGPHLSAEGEYRGNLVWLRITAEPPEQFEPGRLAHVYELRLEDLW